MEELDKIPCFIPDNTSGSVNNCTDGSICRRTTAPLPIPVIIISAVILAVGFLGNVFIIIIVYSLKKLRNVQNIFVTNLCFADVLLAINMCFALVEELVPTWRLEVRTNHFALVICSETLLKLSQFSYKVIHSLGI